MANYNSQMDLGNLSAELSIVPSDTPVRTEDGFGLEGPHSYRGYYDQAAIEPTTQGLNAGELEKVIDDFIGTTVEGWKGGDFYMDVDTPVWISHEGSASQQALVGTEMRDGVLVLITEDYGF